ncbi:MAG: hypothetical protein IJ405_02570 [Lachnospiraceae bacterium]|nr:hypothetical protein [Lachnospiraceae bacterium]
MGYMTAGKLQQVENQLQSYQILFWLCVAGAIIFAIVAIFLFFYFHIPTVFLELTGIRRKWAIQKIQKSNAPIQLKKTKKEKKPKIVKDIGAEETQLLSEDVTTGEETAVLKPQDMFVVEKELKMVETEKYL